ncbi:MAG: efflux RND transporter periplasmic adaptor subunit [bacterium]|nr:efflux RND transporter periplasmic adaptor subunit [bacterium]
MKNKKTLTIVLIAVFVLTGGLLLKSLTNKTEQGFFKFAQITRGDLVNIVSSTGTLSAVETVNIGSQVSGNIEKIYVDFNDRVKKGQLLLTLDKTLLDVAVTDAEAKLLRAKAKSLQAAAELKRNRPLFEKGHLSEMEFLVTSTNADTALSDVKSAEAALKRAMTQLAYAEIRSPIEGTVIERTVDEGQTIAANFQAPVLFVIAQDLKRMQIEVSVDESDIGQIKESQQVRFTVQAYPDDEFTGSVRQIRLQPVTIQNVVNYTVVVDATNKDETLLPGMTATVDFLVSQQKDALLVPNAALSFKPTREMFKQYAVKLKANKKAAANALKPPAGMGRVFYLDEQKVPRMATFIIGANDGVKTQIRSSVVLKEGTQVITSFQKGKKEKAKSPAFTLPKPPGAPH